MVTIQRLEGDPVSKPLPSPYEFFDFIAGSGTGGLLSIMLARLKMTVDDSISEFQVLCEAIFAHPRIGTIGGVLREKYDHHKLEQIIRKLVEKRQRFYDDSLQTTRFQSDEAECRTIVLSQETTGQGSSTVLLKSYQGASQHSPSIPLKNLNIWEAARATVASATYFKPMTIGDNQFTDAAPQIHNPTTIAYKEVLSMDPSTTPQEVAVVSLGSGKAKSVNVGLRKATISPPDKSHEAMIYSSLNGQLFPYFRFDVTQGLEAIASDEWKEWKVSARRPNESTFSKIERITNEYLAQQDVFQSMEEAARILIEQRYLRSTSRSRKRAEGKTANVSNRAISIFPSQRNRNFIAREEILENIERKTFPGSRLALSGLGGIGKSAIALEYAYRFQQRHGSHIFWLSCANIESINSALRRIAQLLDLPGTQTAEDLPYLLLDWVKKRNIEPGLFVFDDVPDSGLISPLMEPLMRESTDSILLTTRDRRVALAMAGPGNIIEVIPMDKFSAATMLRSCISPSVELDAGEFDDVLGIVEILECTPQAVVQAAIYISSACVKPREFLAILRDIETQGDILSHKPGVSGAQSILEQIRITIVQLDPRSRHLLTLMAFLGEDPIPESLLHAIDESKSSSLEAVNQLQSLYLISTDWESHANRRSYFVHNLVRIAVRLDAMVTNTITSIQEKALAIISEKFPSGEYDTWAECELLLSAALAVTNNVLSYEDSRLQRATLLSKVSRYATLRFAYDGLIWDTLPGMCETAFQAYEELLGGEHPETLNSASAWVVVMQLQGRFHHAKELLQRTLGLTEKVFGHYSLHYMDRLYLMANLLRDQAYYHDGPYEQPLQLYQDIVKWDEEVIGSEHPDALVRLNALAVTLYAEGEIGQAINMSKHVLDARLRIIGKEHTDTLTSMIDFAQMLCGQGRVEEGRQWLKEAFFYRPVLSGAAGRHKFASILLDQNELDRARMICEDAFEHISTGILRQVPQILETVSTFGSVLMALELYSAAEIRFEEARAGWEKIFGPDHRLSIECLQRRTEASDKIMRQKQLEVDSSDAISKMTTRLKESTQTSSTPEKQSKMPLQSEKRPGSRSGSQQQLKISRSMDQVTFPSVLTKLIKTILPFENTNWPGLGRFGESQHLFLGKVLPAHHIPNMLGRLVFDRADPLREFIPHSENLGPLNPPDIVTTIGDAPVTYSEVSGILKSADAYRARSRMMNAALMTSPLLRLFYLQAFPSIDFEALGVNQYNMVSHSQILNTLVQDGHFREQLFELIRATGQSTFFMVTSMLTARKLTRTTAAAKHTGFRNDVVGAELSVDVGLPTGETTLVTSRDERIRIEQDVIFALAYEKVEVQRDRWGIRTVISAEKRASSPSKPVVRYRGRGFRVSYF